MTLIKPAPGRLHLKTYVLEHLTLLKELSEGLYVTFLDSFGHCSLSTTPVHHSATPRDTK